MVTSVPSSSMRVTGNAAAAVGEGAAGVAVAGGCVAALEAAGVGDAWPVGVQAARMNRTIGIRERGSRKRRAAMEVSGGSGGGRGGPSFGPVAPWRAHAGTPRVVGEGLPQPVDRIAVPTLSLEG
jgi:hypothetical protein